jgi:hypothetical protein
MVQDEIEPAFRVQVLSAFKGWKGRLWIQEAKKYTEQTPPPHSLIYIFMRTFK